MTLLQAIILAIIEGLTEFLPVSSTGHIILGSTMLGIASNDFVKVFTVVIQLGAILSVITLYWRRFFQSTHFYLKLFVGVLPALALGFLLNDYIDALLEDVLTVAIALIVGGVILILLDRAFNPKPAATHQEPTVKQSFIIGIIQCFALIPGVSRSAATIMGGLAQQLTRQAAAEFSFFLAVPTMFAATVYKLYKYYKAEGGFTGEELQLLAVGNLVAYIVAMLAIRSFVGFLQKRGFRIFGYYRIIVGAVILILHFAGVSLQII